MSPKGASARTKSVLSPRRHIDTSAAAKQSVVNELPPCASPNGYANMRPGVGFGQPGDEFEGLRQGRKCVGPVVRPHRRQRNALLLAREDDEETDECAHHRRVIQAEWNECADLPPRQTFTVSATLIPPATNTAGCDSPSISGTTAASAQSQRLFSGCLHHSIASASKIKDASRSVEYCLTSAPCLIG